MLVSMKEILADAVKNGYAVGGFNCASLESAMGLDDLFSFDDEGYVHDGRRTAYGDIKTVDRSKWEKKDIIKVDGITLDAWHHVGVREFEKKLRT